MSTASQSPVSRDMRDVAKEEHALESLPSLNRENESPYFLSADGETKNAKRLPDWLNHFNKKDLKTLFKCSIAVWIATIFIYINPIADNFGTATFFGTILLFIIPPSGVVFTSVMGGLTMVFGMCLGWAWGVISMKAALATRPAAETNAKLAQLGAAAQAQVPNAEQSSGQAAYTQVLIFEGFMLDPRVVITYFCMIGLFIYMIARLRVAAPKLVLTQIFGIVVSDIFLTIGPLLPSFSGTIPQVLVKPAVTAVGIGMVCNILFFPQSTSYIVLEGIEDILSPLKGLLDACLVSFERPSAQFDPAKLQATRAHVIAAGKGVDGGLGFLALDISAGRWNTEDIKSLILPVRQLSTSFLALLQFQIHRVEAKSKMTRLTEYGKLLQEGDHSKTPIHGHHQLAHALDLRQQFEPPQAEELVGKSLRALFNSSGNLLTTSTLALDAIVDAIHQVNTRRWLKRPSVSECEDVVARHEEVLRQLRKDTQEFAALTTEHLLDPHSHLFDKNGRLAHPGQSETSPLHGLLLGMVFEEKLLGVAEALEVLLARVVELEKHRTKTRIWPPTGLRQAGAYLTKHDSTPGVSSPGDDPVEAHKLNRKEKKKQKSEHEPGTQEQFDALRFHGGHKRSKLSKIVLGVADWFSNTEGMYALRILVVSIALALPAVFHSSAGFYYREKGLWALIMAQTGLVTYTADFVYGFIIRVAGTIMGGVLGMVIWYIGAGHGPGNPYGMAAIMALAIVCIMWARLFAPPAYLQGVMLLASTSVLVMAYSWADTHQPSYGNPGVGFEVFWRRTLLVLIGFVTAAIVTFLPRPPSAARHNCEVISGTIRTNKDLYALLLASWRNPHDDLSAVAEKLAIQNAETLAALAGPIALLRFEFSSSNFDSATLRQVLGLCVTINESLGQLLIFSVKLSQQLKNRFASLSGALDEGVIGDIMAVLTLVEQALKTGDPLPAMLPVPLVARCLGASRNTNTDAEWDRHALSLDLVREESFRKYCVVLSAFVQLLGAVDELVFVVKGAVGETQIVDLEDGEWGSLLRGRKEE